MVTTHFGLVSGLFWAPRDTKMARFGPKCPFLGPKKLKKLPFRAVSPKIPICTWAEVAKFSRNAAHGIQLTILRQNKAKKIGQVKKCRNDTELPSCIVTYNVGVL